MLHYLWLAKVGVLGPYYYAAWLVVLFAIRVADAVRRARARARRPASERGLTPRPARPA